MIICCFGSAELTSIEIILLYCALLTVLGRRGRLSDSGSESEEPIRSIVSLAFTGLFDDFPYRAHYSLACIITM